MAVIVFLLRNNTCTFAYGRTSKIAGDGTAIKIGRKKDIVKELRIFLFFPFFFLEIHFFSSRIPGRWRRAVVLAGPFPPHFVSQADLLGLLGWPTSGEASSSGWKARGKIFVVTRSPSFFPFDGAARVDVPHCHLKLQLCCLTSEVSPSSSFCFVLAKYSEAIVRNRFLLSRFRSATLFCNELASATCRQCFDNCCAYE